MFEGLRILSLRGEVNEETTGEIIDYILGFNAEDSDIPVEQRIPIELHIQSVGGSVLDGISLIDIILSSKTPIYTYCDGYAESIAFVIFVVGHKRFGYEHSTFMYHGMSMQNDFSKLLNIASQVNHFKAVQVSLTNIITKRTELSEEDIKNICGGDSDWYANIDDAIALGIVTDVVV